MFHLLLKAEFPYMKAKDTKYNGLGVKALGFATYMKIYMPPPWSAPG